MCYVHLVSYHRQKSFKIHWIVQFKERVRHGICFNSNFMTIESSKYDCIILFNNFDTYYYILIVINNILTFCSSIAPIWFFWYENHSRQCFNTKRMLSDYFPTTQPVELLIYMQCFKHSHILIWNTKVLSKYGVLVASVKQD